MKSFWLYVLAIIICLPLGVLPAGLGFLASVFLVMRERPLASWYSVVVGALVSDILAVLAGDSMILFWALLIAAAILLSCRSLPRTAALVAAAWLLMKTEPVIYISLFVGTAWNSILLFTTEKKYDKINVIEQNEREACNG